MAAGIADISRELWLTHRRRSQCKEWADPDLCHFELMRPLIGAMACDQYQPLGFKKHTQAGFLHKRVSRLQLLTHLPWIYMLPASVTCTEEHLDGASYLSSLGSSGVSLNV